MDKIIIENLCVFAKHGVLPEENSLGQKFIFSAEIETDIKKAGTTDSIDDTLNYAAICADITSFNAINTFSLIEAAAEHTAEMILKKYKSAESVKLTVKKPWAPIGLPLDYAAVSIERRRSTAYIALGSNMGNKKAYLDRAIKALNEDEKCFVTQVSDYIVTEPVGGIEQDDFLNACIEIKTLYSPFELLDKLHEIENSANRIRTIHWGPRTLDLDIILYNEEIINTRDLKIPHTEAENRTFVLEPLAQIAPYAKNPVNGLTVSEMLRKIKA